MYIVRNRSKSQKNVGSEVDLSYSMEYFRLDHFHSKTINFSYRVRSCDVRIFPCPNQGHRVSKKSSFGRPIIFLDNYQSKNTFFAKSRRQFLIFLLKTWNKFKYYNFSNFWRMYVQLNSGFDLEWVKINWYLLEWRVVASGIPCGVLALGTSRDRSRGELLESRNLFVWPREENSACVRRPGHCRG